MTTPLEFSHFILSKRSCFVSLSNPAFLLRGRQASQANTVFACSVFMIIQEYIESRKRTAMDHEMRSCQAGFHPLRLFRISAMSPPKTSWISWRIERFVFTIKTRGNNVCLHLEKLMQPSPSKNPATYARDSMRLV